MTTRKLKIVKLIVACQRNMYIIKNWYWKLFLFVICLKNIVASEISIESLEEIFSNENNLARTQAIVDKKFDMKYFETDE